MCSSSSFSFSSSEDEGAQLRDSSACEDRIVVATSRAGSDPSDDIDKGARDRDKQRKNSKKKRHRKDDRRRKRSGSSSSAASGEEDEHRRRRRKKRKSKKERKRDSKRDSKRRRGEHHENSHNSRSRSRSRSRSASVERMKERSEGISSKRRRLPKPSMGRSFASVSKSFGDVRPPSPKVLMIGDGKVEDDGTRGTPIKMEKQQNDIDFIQAYREACIRNCHSDADKDRQSLLLPMDYEMMPIEGESDLNRLYLDKQKRLNEMVRANPSDTEAWLALANLHHPMSKQVTWSKMGDGDASKKQSIDTTNKSRESARLERKREILTRGVRNNLEHIALRTALIETLERQCLLSVIPEKEVEAESDAAIRMFEVLVAEEYNSDIKGAPSAKKNSLSSHVHSLVALHRMRLRRNQRREGFTADMMRDSFIEAFSSITKACGVTRSAMSPPLEMLVLFLDYLRAEAVLGYSERAVALIQAALEINLYRHSESDGDKVSGGSSSWEAAFFNYWNSEAPRLGDDYPHAGWLEWERRAKLKSGEKEIPLSRRKKAKKRLKASDFFAENTNSEGTDAFEDQEIGGEKESAEASIDRAQNLVSAYTSANMASESTKAPATATRATVQVEHILDAARSAVEKQEERKRRREQEELDMYTDNDNMAETAIFAAEGTDVAPSQIHHPKPTHAYVYSFLLNRRIEVSLDELSGEATKKSLRSTLAHLRAKNKGKAGANKASNVVKTTEEKLHAIQEDDTFLRWAMEEAKTQASIFSLPQRSLQGGQDEPDYYDPNERIWLEDGIQWVVTPYFSHFADGSGIAHLVSVCLEFLGVTFPRSLLADLFDRNRHVLGTSASGGERLDQSRLSNIFDGVMKPSTDKFNPLSSDSFSIYRQLLIDESTVCFDERIFQSDQQNQKRFLRNCLYSIAAQTDRNTEHVEREPTWRSYVQIALIAFEARASGEKTAEVTQSVLAGTVEAKYDPRLIMEYALLDYKLRLSRDPNNSGKAFKSVSKMLLTAMEAGGPTIFRGQYSSWWLQLVLMTLRSMLCLPIGEISADASTTMSFPKLSDLSLEQRDRILHILCCAIEGTFRPLPKKKSKQGSKEAPGPPLVDDARVRKCLLDVRTKIDAYNKDDVESLLFSSHRSAKAFDCTPAICYFAILSAWLAALNSKKCQHGGVDFAAGTALLDDFAAIEAPQGEGDRAGFQTYLVRIAHAKLELAILRAEEIRTNHTLRPVPFAYSLLVSNISQQKSLGIMPSRPLMLATAACMEMNSYGVLLAPALQSGGIHPNEIIFLLAKAVAAADRTIVAADLVRPKCSLWTKDGRKMVEEAIISAIDKSGYCCYPSLYSALLQLSLIGSMQSKRASRAFHQAKNLYHSKILPSCSSSKSLWLDAFMLLRPTYSETEMVYHLAAMEEKDLRLRKGLEGVLRMAGG